ncbi:fumarylacetoacetate hydrolase family protein [Dermacoccaceae bacterium W4C1]
MRIARYTTGEDPSYGLVDGAGEKIAQISGDPLYTRIELTGETTTVDEVRLLAPVIPRSKVIGIGRNYAAHAAELGNEIPEYPLMFMMPNTSVIGPDDPVVMPPEAGQIDYEGELAVVIGRMCRDVTPQEARQVVFGFTCANDVSARVWQKTDGQWTRAKGSDTFNPLGPWIETDLDVADVRVRTLVDGQVRQDGRTSAMINDVWTLISIVSQSMTLLPGDVILTGTPEGVGPVEPGQRVTVEVEGIGSLTNPFLRRD